MCTTTHKVDSGLRNVAARRFDLIGIDGPTTTNQRLASRFTVIIGDVQISTSCEQRMYGGQLAHFARNKIVKCRPTFVVTRPKCVLPSSKQQNSAIAIVPAMQRC